MADSDSDSWVIADVESDNQEELDDGFCLLEGENDSESDAHAEDNSESDAHAEDYSESDANAELEAAAEDSFDEFEFPMLLCNSTAQRPEDYTEFPRHVNVNKGVRIEDVLREHALHFLPAKSLCRFRAVSRGWDLWISNPFFAHRQTTYFKNISGLFCQVPGCNPSFISFNKDAYGMPDPSLGFLPERVNIRSSCNGLLCCQSLGDNVYYICNPVTKQWKMLPTPTLYHGAEAAIVLAFEPHPLNFNESYELVCAVTVPDSPVVHFEIYSSRSSSWRVSDTICCELHYLGLHSGGYYMKGFAYWQFSSGAILAFDVRSEQYGVLPLPLSAGPYGALAVMSGELCYTLPGHQDDYCNIHIYGGMDMSRETVIRLNSDDVGRIYGVCRALPSVEDDVLILALGRKVIAYHVREQRVEVICTAEVGACNTYLPYVNSLVQVRHPLVKEWD